MKYREMVYRTGSQDQWGMAPAQKFPRYNREEVERGISAVIDFPFSIVLDTILLPWDLACLPSKDDRRERETSPRRGTEAEVRAFAPAEDAVRPGLR